MKTNRNGLTSISCRITLNKSRKEFSTGIFVNPTYWSKEKQKLLDETEDSKMVYSQLSLIKQKLSQAFLMLEIKGDSFDVYKIYCDEDTKKEMGVIAIYTEHNAYYKKLVVRI